MAAAPPELIARAPLDARANGHARRLVTTPLGARSERLVLLGPPLVLAAGLLAVSLLLLLYDERQPGRPGVGDCVRLTPAGAGANAVVSLPPGRSLILSVAGAGTVQVGARRLSPQFTTLHDLPAAGSPALLGFPRDTSTLPWKVSLTPSSPTTVCMV